MDPTWWAVAIAGLFVGFVVGLTGMGGGALMTPMMILFFGVQPLAAVSSDLVASMVMKPVGGAVHLRKGTVNKEMVRWLVTGSVPSAFLGVLLLRSIGDDEQTQNVVKTSLGVALIFAAGAMVAKALLDLRKAQRLQLAAAAGEQVDFRVEDIRIRKVPTLFVGIIGGLVVGMTSVGSGSLMIVALLLLYPTIRAGQLVGTDLVQAVPLVASASLGHLLFGDFQLDLTVSLLIGALPGVYVGARVSSSAPGGIIRRALVVVLLASGLKLLERQHGGPRHRAAGRRRGGSGPVGHGLPLGPAGRDGPGRARGQGPAARRRHRPLAQLGRHRQGHPRRPAGRQAPRARRPLTVTSREPATRAAPAAPGQGSSRRRGRGRTRCRPAAGRRASSRRL